MTHAADAQPPRPVRLDGGGISLVIATDDEAALLYWGPQLAADADLAALAALGRRDIPPAAPSTEPRIALTPVMARGFVGTPGLAGHRQGRDWAPMPVVTRIEPEPAANAVRIVSMDERCNLELVHRIALDPDSGVLSAASMLTNRGQDAYWLEHVAAPVLPLPGWAEALIGFSGRWAGEFACHRQPIAPGTYLRENRRGRTSHDCPPQLIVTDTGCGEAHGRAAGFHLGASANHSVRLERLADGRGWVALAELLLPGEVMLAPGQSYASPTLYAAVGDQGLNGLSDRFHRFVRTRILPPEVAAKPRPVHYNSWEAVYFDHQPGTLRELADRAAALGVERFVLDDGWFGARRSDRAGLGDWTVSRAVYPDGLDPLIAHVRGLGMQFGLWVEPEMVNPDSDLFRAHPDWVLALPGVPQIEARHQYVLDLTRAEVAEHLFGALDALLSAHAIGYLKWDMNRDINHPGSHGRAAASRQAQAVHALIDRVRAAHPEVEIESCASGGGRANFEILKRTHRIWTSDSNDALDRLTIQRGFSCFYPAEIMGAHVGPRRCHITGRVLPMQLRAAVALFGHMGVEMDLRELDPAEAETLSAAIALYKRHRALLHGGRLVRLDSPAETDGLGVVSRERDEALFLHVLREGHAATLPGRYRFDGIDPARSYSIDLVWAPPLPDGAAIRTALQHRHSGAVLMHEGIALPLMHPQSALIFHLAAV